VKRKISIFNTPARAAEPFCQVNDPVGMYCCGPTVYNYAHIGNLRTYIFEDVLKKTLEYFGYNVKHVINITDVGHLTSDADTGDDKMEKGALREGKSVWDIAAFYTEAFRKNLADLNISEPDVWAKATDYIPEMIKMVRELELKGFTYKTSDGIYFDTEKFPAYADFAGIEIDNLQAGSRVDMGEKRRATDFALWKFSPEDSKRLMEWDSPWGKGFPGWHIECSVMSLANLVQPIDIHCGGMDHVRVHHTNEIAQSEAATGKKYVRYWLHGEFLVVDKGKMAKSGNNFVTLDTVKNEGVSPLAYRMFCFSAHYRSPLMFSWEGLKSSGQGLLNLKKLVAAEASKPEGVVDITAVDSLLEQFENALCDDMNMPVAMASVWNMLRDAKASPAVKYEAVARADAVLGLSLLVKDENKFEKEIDCGGLRVKLIGTSDPGAELVDWIVAAVKERKIAKSKKDFAMADELRAGLLKKGVEVKDMPGSVVECLLR
jgi:cysteinyl-tRNA synthetase